MKHCLRPLKTLLLLATLAMPLLANADNFDVLRAQEKAVCESNCYSTEGMMFLSQGGPFSGPNATQQCLSACACIDRSLSSTFSQAEFMSFMSDRVSSPSAAKHDQLVRMCVSQSKF